MSEPVELYEVCEELARYAELDGTEWGESTTALINVGHFGTYYSEEFKQLLDKEIRDTLEYVKENAEIVEGEYTTTHKTIDLEWY